VHVWQEKNEGLPRRRRYQLTIINNHEVIVLPYGRPHAVGIAFATADPRLPTRYIHDKKTYNTSTNIHTPQYDVDE